MSHDSDAERRQQLLAKRTHRRPRHGIPGAGALQNIANVGTVVLENTGKIGMSRPRLGYRDLFISVFRRR